MTNPLPIPTVPQVGPWKDEWMETAPAEWADIALVNLTPHAVFLHHPHYCPDVVEQDDHWRMGVIPVRRDRDGEVLPAARVVSTYEDAPPFCVPDGLICGPVTVPLRTITFDRQQITGLPDPDPTGRLRYIVSPPVALAAVDRHDLVVVDRPVRNAQGTIVGCRGLAVVR